MTISEMAMGQNDQEELESEGLDEVPEEKDAPEDEIEPVEMKIPEIIEDEPPVTEPEIEPESETKIAEDPEVEG